MANILFNFDHKPIVVGGVGWWVVGGWYRARKNRNSNNSNTIFGKKRAYLAGIQLIASKKRLICNDLQPLERVVALLLVLK